MDFPDILSKNSSEDTTEEQVRRIICTEDTRVVLRSWNFMAAKIRRLNFNIKPSYNIFNFTSVPLFEVKKKYFVISNRSRHISIESSLEPRLHKVKGKIKERRVRRVATKQLRFFQHVALPWIVCCRLYVKPEGQEITREESPLFPWLKQFNYKTSSKTITLLLGILTLYTLTSIHILQTFLYVF